MLLMVACESGAPARCPEVALEQRHAGALDRDVGASAHGDADIGRGERRRIVDAVAGHGDDAAFASQPLRRPALFRSGRTSASTSSMPSRRATASAVVAVVAGQHDDADALGLAAPRAPRASSP